MHPQKKFFISYIFNMSYPVKVIMLKNKFPKENYLAQFF